MNRYLKQVESNEKLLDFLDKEVSEDFFDWKIIICFHTTLHYIKALLDHKNIKIHDSHAERNYHLNPKYKDNKEKPALFPLPKDYWQYYFDMYRASRQCRYDGIVPAYIKTSLRKASYLFYRDFLPKFRKYLKSEKVPDA